MIETKGIIEQYDTLDEAFREAEKALMKAISEGFVVRDGSSIERQGPKWRVGLMFAKGASGDIQV